MGVGIIWFSLASALLPAVAITPWTAAAGLTLPAVLAARFLVGFGEGELPANAAVRGMVVPAQRELPVACPDLPSPALPRGRRGAALHEQPRGP